MNMQQSNFASERMEEGNWHTKCIQSRILLLYDAFLNICKEHDFRFYALYGTVLGAVRHRGFIPWDDDMDVAMPRSDYEKFLNVVENALPKNMKFICWERTPGYKNMFGKIVLDDPSAVQACEQEMKCFLPEGIFLDVFPIDGLSRSNLARYWHLIRRSILKAKEYALGFNFKKKFSIKGLCCWFLGGVFAPFYRHYKTVRDFRCAHSEILKECDFYSSPYIAELGWITKEWKALREIHKYQANIWGEPIWAKFEETVVPLPGKVVQYLQNTYGDYMKLPPQECRRPSHSKNTRAK